MFGITSRLPRAALSAAAAGAAGAAAWQVWPWTSHAEAPVAPALSSAEWRKFKVTEKKALTTTANPTLFLRLAFPDAEALAGYDVASCLMVRAPVKKEDGSDDFAARPYTPVSLPGDKGVLDLIVKVYKTTPKPGVIGTYVEGLEVGDEVEVKGPFPKIPLSEIARRKTVDLVAGGSGITPVLQVAEELLRLGSPARISLIFANTSEDEIILRDRLDELAARHDNFNVHYVVDKASSKNWAGSTGYVTSALLKQKLASPSDSTIVLVCGPPPMVKSIAGPKVKKDQGPLGGILKELGYSEGNVFKF